MHQHLVSYFVMPAIGNTPDAIVDSLDEARDALRQTPAYLDARIDVVCWHPDCHGAVIHTTKDIR